MVLKALMLDVDGVVIRHPDPAGWSSSLESDLGISVSSLHEAFFVPHWDDVVNGRANLRERLDPVLAEIAPQVSGNALISYWFSHDSYLDQQLLSQIALVRARGLQVHLATVQEHERAAYLWDDLGLSKVRDAMHYAAALGCSKPSAAFYEAIETRSGFSPAEILFIDDSERNVLAALARGWRAALWSPGAELATLFPELA